MVAKFSELNNFYILVFLYTVLNSEANLIVVFCFEKQHWSHFVKLHLCSFLIFFTLFHPKIVVEWMQKRVFKNTTMFENLMFM